MAALQKIRNHGVLLVTVIAVALFLFVMGDLVRGGEGLLSQSKQQVGEVLGQTLSIQDYNDMVNDLQNYYEIIGQDASGEDQLNRIKDEAWQTYVQNKLIQTGQQSAVMIVIKFDLKAVSAAFHCFNRAKRCISFGSYGSVSDKFTVYGDIAHGIFF